MGCVRTILLLIEAKALRSGRNKNNINMCNRSSLIMNNFRDAEKSVFLLKGLNDGPRYHILHAIQSGCRTIICFISPSTHLCTRSTCAQLHQGKGGMVACSRRSDSGRSDSLIVGGNEPKLAKTRPFASSNRKRWMTAAVRNKVTEQWSLHSKWEKAIQRQRGVTK